MTQSFDPHSVPASPAFNDTSLIALTSNRQMKEFVRLNHKVYWGLPADSQSNRTKIDLEDLKRHIRSGNAAYAYTSGQNNFAQILMTYLNEDDPASGLSISPSSDATPELTAILHDLTVSPHLPEGRQEKLAQSLIGDAVSQAQKNGKMFVFAKVASGDVDAVETYDRFGASLLTDQLAGTSGSLYLRLNI